MWKTRESHLNFFRFLLLWSTVVEFHRWDAVFGISCVDWISSLMVFFCFFCWLICHSSAPTRVEEKNVLQVLLNQKMHKIIERNLIVGGEKKFAWASAFERDFEWNSWIIKFHRERKVKKGNTKLRLVLTSLKIHTIQYSQSMAIKKKAARWYRTLTQLLALHSASNGRALVIYDNCIVLRERDASSAGFSSNLPI